VALALVTGLLSQETVRHAWQGRRHDESLRRIRWGFHAGYIQRVSAIRPTELNAAAAGLKHPKYINCLTFRDLSAVNDVKKNVDFRHLSAVRQSR
jgi:hypothetical protein